jgi:putative cell wall-binding protein
MKRIGTLLAGLGLLLTAALTAPAHAIAASPPDAPSWLSRDWIVNTAAAQDGDPYVWGADGPSAFDCSGFTSFCWKVSVYYGGNPRMTTSLYYNNASGPGSVVCYDIPGTSADHYSTCARGDALVYNNGSEGHIVLFRDRNPDGSVQTWEARGAAYGCGSFTRSYSSLVNTGFKAIRRRNVNQPGAVSMVAPTTPGVPVHVVGMMRAQANASDEDGISYVQFSKTGPLRLDTTRRWYGKATAAPYTWELDTGGQIVGDYRLGAKVVDPNGQETQASEVDVSFVSHDRIGGATRYETAVAASRQKYPNGGASAVVLVRGDDPADAMSAAPLAAYSGGPVLYTQTDVLPDATRSEIARLDPARVIVLGGANVISDSVMQQACGSTTYGAAGVRLAGSSRYGTARRVREYMGNPQKTVLINSQAVADAMSVSSAAAYRDYSILLCTTSSIPPDTAAAIAAGATRVIVVGGTPVVDAAAFGQIPTANSSGQSISRTRVSGDNRYATSVAIANSADFSLAGERPHLVNGGDTSWPDGLCVGPLAGANPTFLVDQYAAPADTLAELRRRGPSVVRLIGSTAVTYGYVW